MMTLLLNWCKALFVKMSSKQLGQSQRESEAMYIDLRIIYRKVIITDENPTEGSRSSGERRAMYLGIWRPQGEVMKTSCFGRQGRKLKGRKWLAVPTFEGGGGH